MTYALIVSNTIQSEGGLPGSARRLDTQQWVLGLTDASTALQQACGYYTVTDVVRPVDTATQTYDRTLTLVGQVPTVTWTARNKTPAELTATTTTTNRATIEARTATLIAQMDTIVATTGTLTALQLSGAVRQIAAGLRGIVRYTMNQLDSPD